eukprot:SM000013S26455  [mRNA]  locus=s13:445406:448674:- [translate_table: standard]
MVRPRTRARRHGFRPLRPGARQHPARFLATTPFAAAAAGHGRPGAAAETDAAPAGRPLVLYRGRWIRVLRVAVRFKVLQLMGVAGLALPIAQYTTVFNLCWLCPLWLLSHVIQGSLPLATLAAVGAVSGGALAASGALWYYSRRYIGELAVLPSDRPQVRISTLNFWGNREVDVHPQRQYYSKTLRSEQLSPQLHVVVLHCHDLVVDLSNVVPPLKGLNSEGLRQAVQQLLLPLDVINHRQFIISLRHGILVDKIRLLRLLTGTLLADEEPILKPAQASHATMRLTGPGTLSKLGPVGGDRPVR